MEYIYQTITLGLHSDEYPDTVFAKQGDTAMVLKIDLWNDGKPYTIGAGCHAVLAGEKPDGTFLLSECGVENHSILYRFTPQTTSALGCVQCAVKLYGADDALITSEAFRIQVMPTVNADNQAQSKDEVSALTHLISEAAAVIQEGNEMLHQGETILTATEQIRQETEEMKTAAMEASQTSEAAAETAKTLVADAQAVLTQASEAADRAMEASQVAYDAERKVDTLTDVVRNLHNNIAENASGVEIALSDSGAEPLQGLTLYGKTTRNGTPTPSAPAALKSVGDGGTVKVRVCGKNLFSPKKFPVTTSKNGITFVNNGDGSFDISGTASADTSLTLSWSTDGSSLADIIRLGGSFVFSCDQAVYENKTFNCSIVYKYAGGNRYILASGLPTEVPAGAEYASMSIWISSGTTVKTVTNGHLQLEYGTVATAYEPYKDVQTLQVATANGLPGIPVAQGGNYTDGSGQRWVCDEVDFRTGKYVQRVGVKQFASAAEFTLAPGGQNQADRFCVNTGEKMLALTGLSTMHPDVDLWGTGDCAIGFGDGASTSLYARFPGITTLEQLGSLLTASPLTVMYGKAVPALVDLTAEQLSAFGALHTNYPNTIVINDAGVHMGIGYVADTKLYVDKKFRELAAAMEKKL